MGSNSTSPISISPLSHSSAALHVGVGAHHHHADHLADHHHAGLQEEEEAEEKEEPEDVTDGIAADLGIMGIMVPHPADLGNVKLAK